MLLAILCFFLITGCQSSTISPNMPYEMTVNGSAINYNDSIETLSAILGQYEKTECKETPVGEETKFEQFGFLQIEREIPNAYNGNKMNLVSITSNEVKTFGGISVGDDIKDVKKKYPIQWSDFEDEGTIQVCFFDGTNVQYEDIDFGNEIEKYKTNKEKCVWISYRFDNAGTIESIHIYDDFYRSICYFR